MDLWSQLQASLGTAFAALVAPMAPASRSSSTGSENNIWIVGAQGGKPTRLDLILNMRASGRRKDLGLRGAGRAVGRSPDCD